MTSHIIYLTESEAISINELVTRQRGLLRDENLLASAINRPQMAAYYSQADLVEQAVALIEGIALNHPFIDGNKRTAMIAGLTFLNANGGIITSSSDELGRQIEALVISKDTQTFLIWIRKHIVIH